MCDCKSLSLPRPLRKAFIGKVILPAPQIHETLLPNCNNNKILFSTVKEDLLTCPNPLLARDELMHKKSVPTQTQIRQQLGSKLSDVFFEYLGSEARTWLGLEPPLVGPDTVWVDPEARLKGKVSLKPVPEPASLRLKALTHDSVLELGQKYITLLENKHRLEMEEALSKQANDLEEEIVRRIQDAKNLSDMDEKEYSKKVVATLMNHFDSCFNELVETTQLRMRRECQERVEEERSEVASLMLCQLQEEIERHEYDLCNDFHEILFSELNTLAGRFVKQIDDERQIAVQVVQETVRKYEKMLQDVKVEMELGCFVDNCRSITEERLDCSEKLKKIECENKCKVEKLLACIEDLKKRNSTLQMMSTERLKRLMQWRKKVRSLLTEFQRFINFAVKAVPAQSEFLLSMEKLMLKKFPQDSFLLPEDYLHFQECMKGKLPPEDLREPSSAEVVPTVVEEESKTEEEDKSSQECDQDYCQSILYQEKQECDYSFNFDDYKSRLKKEFETDTPQPEMGRKKPPKKKAVCIWKKNSKDVSVNRTSELYQMLTLAGEKEREHIGPVNCFLQRRLNAIQKICSDDPEFAKVILGCRDVLNTVLEIASRLVASMNSCTKIKTVQNFILKGTTGIKQKLSLEREKLQGKNRSYKKAEETEEDTGRAPYKIRMMIKGEGMRGERRKPYFIIRCSERQRSGPPVVQDLRNVPNNLGPSFYCNFITSNYTATVRNTNITLMNSITLLFRLFWSSEEVIIIS